MALVRSQLPAQTKATVHIIGEGPRRINLQRQINRLGLGDWVSLLGHRDNAAVRDIHHQGDLFVASSRQEAFGIAAFEARAAGLPVVGYRNTGLIDYITHGTDGLLVQDKREMVAALVALIGHPEQLSHLLHAATTTPPPITTEQATQAIADLYARAIADAPVRPRGATR